MPLPDVRLQRGVFDQHVVGPRSAIEDADRSQAVVQV
jgi:hypothetical protein